MFLIEGVIPLPVEVNVCISGVNKGSTCQPMKPYILNALLSFPSPAAFTIRLLLLFIIIHLLIFPCSCSPPPPPVRLYGCLVFDHLEQVLQILEAAVYFLPHKLVSVCCLFLVYPSSANEQFAKIFRISRNNTIWIFLKKSARGDNSCSAIDTGQRVEVSEGGDV